MIPCAHRTSSQRDVRRAGIWYYHHSDGERIDAALFISDFTLMIANPPGSVHVDHYGQRFMDEGLSTFLAGVHANPPRLHWWQLTLRPYMPETFELTHRGEIVPYAIPEVIA